MARPPLPIGSWGRISTKVMKTDDKGKAVSVRAKANFRDHDGQVRDVTAYATTATAAERAVLKKLQDRAKTGHSSDLTAMHKINHLLDLWEAKFKDQIADGTRSPTSLDTYLRAIKNHIRPALGELRIGELNTPRVDTVISKIKKNTGPPTAKTCRAIISGMMQLAVRYGAITVNPVREVESIEHPAKKPARAIQADEITLLRKHLKADEAAVQADLPDLVTFMLGTGVRIGESLAVLWSQIDLDAATVDVTHTIVRIKGEGLIRKVGKSAASNRQLGLPNWLIATLRSRAAAGIRLDDPIFTDTTGGYRDPNNTRRSLRNALAPVGGAARRNLGLALRAARRKAGLTREEVTKTLNWPKNRIQLVESGRIKVDRPLATTLLWTYKPTPETTEALLTQVDEAAAPVPTDTLTWITSHAFRKTVATALDNAGQSARGAANQLGHSRVSMTQDNYFDRTAPNPAATNAIQQAFEDPEL
ncbi:tyrosine-type recombinase/integrase [Streptomyces sp. SID13031]|uniref:tyrosine-type recombinase/integrase n=1 Tax=Streptomyces sp. SID13031 TaxID=2706046 RepID=UPI0013C5950B|nr:tyrosine-type recombinase/integrase [Streptomyces sp. SID13031]NEA37415.1 tyrosine-type recombinase/integrase [Streptomyces sp. SID13031]